VTIDDPVNLVQRACETLPQVLSEGGELTIFAFLLGHHVDAAKPTNNLAGSQPFTIEPQ
jgi:hypothetical protein